ncbi:MAG: hypothetical protein LBI04_03160 [Treponema sp.]|jgi:hypothetical protein|nr:hypothetical protein [Treponema sp.]
MLNFNTKKTKILFILCLLFLPLSIFAQDDKIAWNNGDNQDVEITPDENVIWVYEVSEKDDNVIEKEQGLIRVPDRKFELGLFNLSLGFSNDFITTSEFFKDKIEIDIDKLSDGFNVNANFAISPIYFSYNKNDIWGFGLSTGLDFTGNIGLNGDMLTFNEVDAAESDIGAAAFAEVKIHSFFTIKKFKFKLKPALYYPIIFVKPDNFSYTFKNVKTNGIDETIFNLELDMRVYTALPMHDDFEFSDIIGYLNKTIGSISARPGIDISIGAEYPLSEVLGLNNKHSFLDFDVGIDFINIPLSPSTMEDYVRMIVNVGSDKPIDLFNGMLSDGFEENDIDDFYNYEFLDYSKDKINVFRPFKILASASWRPFYRPSPDDTDKMLKRKKEWLTFSPILGFAVNPLYSQPVSFEGGIEARLSLANLFIVTIGMGYNDRLWKNSLDLAFNFRLFEIDLGVNMQSPGFIKSWTGSGFGVNGGIKFGW